MSGESSVTFCVAGKINVNVFVSRTCDVMLVVDHVVRFTSPSIPLFMHTASNQKLELGKAR